MPREIRSLLLALACAGVVATGCKQKSKEEADPGGAPNASAAPSATAEAPPPPPDIIPPPLAPPAPPPVASVKAGSGESIKACCTALHGKESTVTPQEKSMYQTTAASCDQISKLVAAGTTKKSAALTTLRAGLRGAALPAGCN